MTHCCAGQVCLNNFLNDLGKGLFTSGPSCLKTAEGLPIAASLLWATATQAALHQEQVTGEASRRVHDATRDTQHAQAQAAALTQQLSDCKERFRHSKDELAGSRVNHVTQHCV